MIKTSQRELQMHRAARFLMKAADTMDRWAHESRVGGWSTHQVEANKALAGDCRQQAALLYSLLDLDE